MNVASTTLITSEGKSSLLKGYLLTKRRNSLEILLFNQVYQMLQVLALLRALIDTQMSHRNS